jgi:DNA modification methylase
MRTVKVGDHVAIHSKMENVMCYLKDSSVDAVITDPPFGVRKTEDWDDKELFIQTLPIWLWESIRVSKHVVIWFCASKMMPYILNAIRGHEDLFRRMHIWDKPEGSQYNGSSHNNMFYAFEPILVFSKDWDKTKAYGKNMPFGTDTLRYRTIAHKQFGHPTSKPVSLMRRLIGHYTDPGEKVLDPFGGSFSTAIACEDMGRKCMVVEQSPLTSLPITDMYGDNPDHFENGVKRLITHVNAPKLFKGEADVEDVDTEDIPVQTIDMFSEIKEGDNG